jgi:hypothetical protein
LATTPDIPISCQMEVEQLPAWLRALQDHSGYLQI